MLKTILNKMGVKSNSITDPTQPPFTRLCNLLTGLIANFDEYQGYEIYAGSANAAGVITVMYRDYREQLICMDIYQDDIGRHVLRIAKELDTEAVLTRSEFVAVVDEVKECQELLKTAE